MQLAIIPPRKLQEAKAQTLLDCETCSKAKLENACARCRKWNEALTRFSLANIPVKYWNLKMKDFIGPKVLADKYNEITSDIKKSYSKGISYCFASNNFGVGKSMVAANILKFVTAVGYSALYVTLNDIVSYMVHNSDENKTLARRELLQVDFLVIDEFDSRHFSGSEASAAMYGRILEDIFRSRAQNTLPIIMCSNQLKPQANLGGTLKDSVDSLMNYVTLVPCMGEDFRKKGM